MNKYCAIASVILLSALPSLCSAQNAIPEVNPFNSYSQVSDRIFVYDESQFSPYSGPDVSHWELRIPHDVQETHDSEMKIYDRERLGVVTLMPALKVYVDVLGDPMTEYVELRDTKDGKLIHQFRYYGAVLGLLLFSGQGVVYEFRQPELMCHGSTTNKYQFENGKLNEIVQPIHYLNDGETSLISGEQLLSEPRLGSEIVAYLPKNTKVTVLSFKHSPMRYPSDSWYLIKTPLGLTGWVPSGLAITACN